MTATPDYVRQARQNGQRNVRRFVRTAVLAGVSLAVFDLWHLLHGLAQPSLLEYAGVVFSAVLSVGWFQLWAGRHE